MKKKNADIISLPSLITTVTLMKLSEKVGELELRHKNTCEMAVRSILHALDCKDNYTFNHSMRVAHYALIVGREMELSHDELYRLELAGLFHDIGKIGIPDSVLQKPARLDEDEFQIMKEHPVKSAEILEGFDDFEEIALIAKHHHERYDGRGYPDGLKGEEIPLFSRIVLIADTFDAMTSSRPYRKGLDFEVAFEELNEFAGTQFDPNLVKHFIEGMRKDTANSEDTFFLQIINDHFKKEAA